MPIKPKDSRLVGFNRVKPRLQRLPKRPAIPAGVALAEDESGARLSYNPPASSPNPLITPTPFLPAHLRQFSHSTSVNFLPPPLSRPKDKTFLTAEQIDEIRDLRANGSSRRDIAKKYATSPFFVSLVAPLQSDERKNITAAEEANKATWSERRQVFSQIRQHKRASWGL